MPRQTPAKPATKTTPTSTSEITMPTTSVEDIKARYAKLNIKLQRYLQDYTNHVLGVYVVAGKDVETGKAQILNLKSNCKTGRPPIPKPVVGTYMNAMMEESLAKRDGAFTTHDVEHRRDLDQLVDYTNMRILADNPLTKEEAGKIVELFSLLNYGLTREERQPVYGKPKPGKK